MKKYKLINITTKEETLCDKVVIDGFDYYLMTTNIKNCWVITDTDKLVKVDKSNYENWHEFNCKKVIATNNPNIDIPKVVDEVEMMALLQYPYPLDVKDKNDKIIQTKGEKPFNHAKIEKYRRAFVIGYNKSQETHPFSEEDMIEFHRWLNKNGWQDYNDIKKGLFVNSYGVQKQDKELLQLWKKQKLVKIYYVD